MKLRLPNKLQAALAAALASVSFTTLSTGSQAQAENISASVTLDTPRNLAENAVADGGESENLQLTSVSYVRTTVQSASTSTLPTDIMVAPNTNVGNGGNWELTFTLQNDNDFAITLGSFDLNMNLFNNGGTAQNAGTVRSASLSVRSTALVETVSLAADLNNPANNFNSPAVVNGTTSVPRLTFVDGLTIDKESSVTFVLRVAKNGTDSNVGTFYGIKSIGVNYSYELTTIPTWNGKDGHANWSDAEAWTNGILPSSATPAVFDSGAAVTTVNIDTTATAHSVTVSGQAYTFNIQSEGSLTATDFAVEGGNQTVNLNGGSLTPGNVTIATDATLSITGSGDVSISSLAGAGGFVKDSSGTLVLNGNNSSYTGGITVNAGLLSFSNVNALGSGTLTVNEGGTIRIATRNMPTSLSVEGNGNLSLMTDTKGTGDGSANIDLKTVSAKNLYLHAEGGDANGYNSRFIYKSGSNLAGVEHLFFDGAQMWVQTDMDFTHAVTFGATTYYESAAAFNKATLRVGNGSAPVAKFSGAIEIQDTFKAGWQGNGELVFAGDVTGTAAIDLASFSGNGKFTVSGDASTNFSGTVTSAAAITLNVTDTGSLRIGSGSNLAGAVTLDGALTVNGAATISGNITGAGSLTKTGEGTLELTSSITTTGAFSVTGGTLVFAGENMLSAGSLSAAAGVTFDLNNIGTTKTGTITLATATGTAGALTDVNVSWTLPSGYTYEDLRVEDNKWVITLNSLGQNLTWAGGTGNWSYNPVDTPWLNAEQQAASFSNKDSAVFKAADTPAVANLTQDITATNVVVENGANVTLQTSSGASLTATVLDIKGTLSSSVDVNATAVTITGADATWNITDGAVTTDTITLTDNASLTLSGAGTVTAAGGISAPDMTVTLASDIVLQGSATDAFNLAGEGTYKLQSGSRSLGNVHLGDADTWHGSVEISGNVGGGHTFQDLSNVNSFVKLNGVTTWLQPNSTIAANLILVGPDEETHEGTALDINAADSNNPYTFSGSIQGTGDIEFSQTGADQGRSAAFHLKGNLAGWSGNFVNKNGGTQNGNWRNPSLYLDGNGSVHMGGGIVQKAGQLDVYLGGNNTTDVTMDGDITRENGTLNLTANKATTFNGAVEASNLTVNADTTVNKGLHVSGATTVAENATLNVANVSYVDTPSLSLGDVTIGAGSTMRVYEGNVFSEQAEAALYIDGGHTLTAEVGATLYANLVMGWAADQQNQEAAVLDVSAMRGDGGLKMGSSVTLKPGEIALSEEDMDLISRLEFKQMYDLFNEVDFFNVGENPYGNTDAWVDAKDVFANNFGEQDYYLFYSGANQGGVGSNVGTIYIMRIPEPTTGTLSLLALCALAARRRRKH